MHRAQHRPRKRRGNYSILIGFLLPVFIGFLAVSVDVAWVTIADSQAQDVADAAAHAALIELRRTGDTAAAEAVAEKITELNRVGNGNGKLNDIQFGNWERGGEFTQGDSRPNAVTTQVGRYGGTDGVNLFFARIWGRDEASVEGDAMAASRSLHVVLVMDVTGSFAADIDEAAKAAVAFLDVLRDTHGPYDKIGMATFYYIYGHERTPLFNLDDEAYVDLVRLDWNAIRHASRIGGDTPDPTNPGPRPHMPREYDKEQGTDHHVGVVQARRMFDKEVDPFAYRAMVVLTDGQPVNLNAGTIRTDIGFVDDRWDVYEGPVPHKVAEIETAAVAQSVAAWDEQRVHTWVVSFKKKNDFMKDMVQGDGAFYFTTNANDLVPIFKEIAYSLPLLIVE